MCILAVLIGLLWYEKTPIFWLNVSADAVFTMIMGLYLFGPKANAFFGASGEAESSGKAA